MERVIRSSLPHAEASFPRQKVNIKHAFNGSLPYDQNTRLTYFDDQVGGIVQILLEENVYGGRSIFQSTGSVSSLNEERSRALDILPNFTGISKCVPVNAAGISVDDGGVNSSLAHAVSCFVWGTSDRDGLLQDLLVSNSNIVLRRWLEVLNRKKDEEDQAYLSHQVKISTMANTFRRPVVVFVTDDQPTENCGIFIPFCWLDTMCLKEPILLSYDGTTFFPSIPIKTQDQHIRVPLVDKKYQLLPVRPLRHDKQNDYSNHYALMQEYLCTDTLKWERKHIVNNGRLEGLNTHIISAVIQPNTCRKDIYDKQHPTNAENDVHLHEKPSCELGESLYTIDTVPKRASSQTSSLLTEMDLDEKVGYDDTNNNFLLEAIEIDGDEPIPNLYEHDSVQTSRLYTKPSGDVGNNLEYTGAVFPIDTGSKQPVVQAAHIGTSNHRMGRQNQTYCPIDDTCFDDINGTYGRQAVVASVPVSDELTRENDTRQEELNEMPPCMGWFGEEVNKCFKKIAKKMAITLNDYATENK